MAALTSTGLVIDTFSALQAQLTADLQTIYGQNINLSSSSPDGQAMNMYVQVAIDTEEVMLQVFNSFDPDQAVGIVLDQRCAINLIQRQQGTFTTTNVKITMSTGDTLYGLDQTANPVYTVTDSVGSMNWQLVKTTTLSTGATECLFQAAIAGPVLTTQNTITVPVTVNLNVSSINNDQAYLTLGVAEETDNQFKVRRQQSVSIGAQGYFNTLFAALQNISGIGVGNVKVYENNTSATSNGTVPANTPSGIPANTVWVIVGGGTASQSTIGGAAGAYANAIATAIYQKRNAGCGLKGGQSYAITQADSSLFPIFWDVVVGVPLFINFTVGSVNGTALPNIAAIVNATTGLPATFVPGINATVNSSQLVQAVLAIDPNTYASSVGFSISSSGFAATLAPAQAYNQFLVTAGKIIITPMVMSSASSVIAITAGIPLTFSVTDNATHSGPTIQYSVLGGYSGAGYTWSVFVNNSGGSISASGLYTPGSTPSVIDTLKVVDTLGNAATVQVTVA